MTEERLRQMLAEHEKRLLHQVDGMLRQFADEFATCQRPMVEGMERLNRMQCELLEAFGALGEMVKVYADKTSEAWQKLCEDNCGPDDADPDWWKRGDSDQ